MNKRTARRRSRRAFKRICKAAAGACFVAALCIMGGIENGAEPMLPLAAAASAAMAGAWAFASAAEVRCR